MRIRALVLAAAFAMAPLGAQAADLVVWWDKGYYAQEDEAVKETVAAFEQETGKQVELVFHPEEEHPEAIEAALEAGQPPDFAFGLLSAAIWTMGIRRSAGRSHGRHRPLFGPVRSGCAQPGDCGCNKKTGQKALYGLPMGRTTNYVHVWKSLLERAGFTLEDIPKEWEAFWAFWCDQVQPAVREALGRDDVWGVGLSMAAGHGRRERFFQFLAADVPQYVTHDGRLVIDDPEVRRRLIEAIDSYTAFYRKGCTPPDAVNWSTGDRNNEAFLAQTVSDDPEHRRSRSRTRSSASVLTTTTRTPPRSNGRLARLARPFRSWAGSIRRRSSRTALTSRPPRSSCASSWARAGSPTISTSPASACCRRCRSCSRQPSGSTRATRTAWLR